MKLRHLGLAALLGAAALSPQGASAAAVSPHDGLAQASPIQSVQWSFGTRGYTYDDDDHDRREDWRRRQWREERWRREQAEREYGRRNRYDRRRDWDDD